MRKIAAILISVFGLVIVASAQVPTSGNIFFGYSYYHTPLSSIDTANMNGWNGSLEGKVFPFLGIVADLSGNYGSQNFPTFCAYRPLSHDQRQRQRIQLPLRPESFLLRRQNPAIRRVPGRRRARQREPWRWF